MWLPARRKVYKHKDALPARILLVCLAIILSLAAGISHAAALLAPYVGNTGLAAPLEKIAASLPIPLLLWGAGLCVVVAIVFWVFPPVSWQAVAHGEWRLALLPFKWKGVITSSTDGIGGRWPGIASLGVEGNKARLCLNIPPGVLKDSRGYFLAAWEEIQHRHRVPVLDESSTAHVKISGNVAELSLIIRSAWGEE